MATQRRTNLNPGFKGHGVVIERYPIDALRRYERYKTHAPVRSISDLVDRFIHAVTDMHMSSVWFQIFNRKGEIDTQHKLGTSELVKGLKSAKIGAVPWGYCFGKNSEDPSRNDLDLAVRICDSYQLDKFIADIEPWNDIGGTPDTWKGHVIAPLYFS